MVKKKTGNTSHDSSQDSTIKKTISILKSETLQFTIGLILIIFSVYMLLSFTSFFFTGAADQSLVNDSSTNSLLLTESNIQNSTGTRGAHMAEFLINQCFGISAYLIALFLAVTGLKLIKAYHFHLWKWFFGCAVPMLWFSIFLSFLFEDSFGNSFIYPGGMHGHNVSQWLCTQIGNTGLILFLLCTAILYLLYISKETINIVRKALHPSFNNKKSNNTQSEIAIDNDNHTESKPYKEAADTTYNNNSIQEKTEEPETIQAQTLTFDLNTQQSKTKEQKENNQDTNTLQREKEKEEEEKDDCMNNNTTETTSKMEVSIGGTDEDKETKQLSLYNPKLDLENYHYPTIDLLKKYEDNTPSIDMEELNANKDRIIEVLKSFGVEISSINATVGPTITLYEITPAQGVRIAKIRNLGSDIALSLSAKGIRIIAPIPGKGTIGIEVPNSKAKIVPMRDIIASKKFQESTYELPIALGKTITNEVFIADLCKMPHVLVAGATGQGKSVGLNAIITSLLYKKHPAELKFVMVDPKMVEFSMYNPIEKHFLAKLPDGKEAIITDPTKVIQTLQSLCIEMDNRYELLKAANVRQIKEYNQKFINRQLNPEKGHKYLPYIVVIIDEFGDLIMTAGKEIETPIARIAQKARAVGIHMIIATQRPAANIITGVIRANFPARIAFKVSTMMESRIILDTPGADQLIGRGDMLISQSNELTRIQCAFVDTPEVERIAEYINKQQGYPTAFYLPEYVGEESDNNIGEVDMNRLDPMFEDAARLIVTYQQGSTSLIQRKFSIGYNRAGRIMDQLERAGIVGPSEGSKARQVLCMDEMDLDMKLKNLLQ